MKSIKIIFVVILLAVLSGCYTGVIITENKKGPPPWAPAHGFRTHYCYYFPNYEFYYYVPTAEFIYLSNNVWVYSTTLPGYLLNINLYTVYKVHINYHGRDPYKNFSKHRKDYPKGGKKKDDVKKDNKKPEKSEKKKKTSNEKIKPQKKESENKGNQKKNKSNKQSGNGKNKENGNKKPKK